MLPFIRKNSLDILAGVAAQGVLASKLLDVPIHWWWLTALTITVWMIYNTDHILDSRQCTALPLNPRHFPAGNKLRIMIMLPALIADGYIVLLYFSGRDLYTGAILAILVLAYVLAEKRIKTKSYFFFPKEIIIAILYVAGIWIYPISWAARPIQPGTAITLFSMVLLALGNTLIFSFYESGQDAREHRFSFSGYFGVKKTATTIKIIDTVVMITAVMLFSVGGIHFERLSSIILIMMASGQVLIMCFPRFFKNGYRYGILNESLFILPLLILLSGT